MLNTMLNPVKLARRVSGQFSVASGEAESEALSATPRTPGDEAAGLPPTSPRGRPPTPRRSSEIEPMPRPDEPTGALLPWAQFARSLKSKQRRSRTSGGSRAPSIASSLGGSGLGSVAPPLLATGGSLQICNGASTRDQEQLLAGIAAEPREIPVHSACSMDAAFYAENHMRPGLCNIQLKARRATAEDLEAWPARLALVDAMKHMQWLADNFDALEKEFPDHGWRDVMTVETGLNVPQELLARLVGCLYRRRLLVEPGSVEQLLHVAQLLQMPAATEALAEYIKADLVPLDPAACHALGARHPEMELEAAVLQHFRELHLDGTVGTPLLQSLGAVLERCSQESALAFVRSLMEPPALAAPLQVAAICTQVSAAKRELLLEGLRLRSLSTADLQSLLHWANNRRSNRAVLADSPVLWRLLYDSLAGSLLPLEQLRSALGPQAHSVKLWDLPLACIGPEADAHRPRRSGWLHLGDGRSFCLEAIRTKPEEPGAEWGLFCKPDREHALQEHYTVWLFALQQGACPPRVQLSPPFVFSGEKRPGLSLGFDSILSEWAADSELVWAKQGEPHLTLGLYVDTHDEYGSPAASLAADPAETNGHAGEQLGLAELHAHESVPQEELPPPGPQPANGICEERLAMPEIVPDGGPG